MTKEQEEARVKELRGLSQELHEGKQKILESLGFHYNPREVHGRDGEPRPPEIKEFERQIFLKIKAVMEKYKE